METIEELPGRCSTKATATVSESERLLLKLGHGYKRAKAQQILRLLKDQEQLNKRFKDCALDDPEDSKDDGKNGGTTQLNNTGPEKEEPNDIKDIEAQLNQRRAVVVKKVASNVDPSRCRTSMGFYNEAECSNSVDGDIDVEAAANADLELEMGAEADTSFDEHDLRLARLNFGSRHGNHRRLFRQQLNEDADVIPEESVAQSARSSRPKTGIASGSARSKQYRRPTQGDYSGKNPGNNIISTTVSKLDGPFTPRGGIRGFCDGQTTPRDDLATFMTPLQNDLKLCLTPRHEIGHTSRYMNTEFKNCFTPRHHDGNICHTPRQNDLSMAYTPRQNDLSMPYTPRQNDLSMPYTPRQSDNNNFFTPRPMDVGGSYTPRQADAKACLTPRQSELCFSPRRDDPGHVTTPRPTQHHQRGLRNYCDMPLTPRDDTTSCATPRREDHTGGITPRSYNKLPGPLNSLNGPSVSGSVRNGRLLETSLFEMTPGFSNEPVRSKRQHGNLSSNNASSTDHGHAGGKRGGQHVSRTVLSVNKNPLHVIPTGNETGEVTPRRQKGESKGKKRGCSEMQRVGVHQNLSKLSEHVHPIAVMKLPPLDTAMNKPVVS